jgi:hypothetical protein
MVIAIRVTTDAIASVSGRFRFALAVEATQGLPVVDPSTGQ